MASDTLTINLAGNLGNSPNSGTAGNNELLSAVNKLAEGFSSFQTSLKTFVDQTKVSSTAMLKIKENLSEVRKANATDPQLKNIAETKSRTAEKNAAIRGSPEMLATVGARAEGVFARNRAQEIRERTVSRGLNQASNLYASGEISSKKFTDIIQQSITTGTNKGLESSKLRSVMTTLGAMGGIGLLSSAVGNVFKSNSQMAIAASQNPILNGYDYGGMVSNVMNINANKNASLTTTALTVAGGALGAFGGLAGVGIGASLGGAAGQVLGAHSTGQAALQAHALSSYVNNYMNLEAMSGTNQAASRLSRGGIGKSPLTNMEVPLIMTMSKGVAIYNDNFKAMSELTKYAKSAQLNLSQAANLSANVGLASKDKGFSIQNMANLFSTYGINPEQYNDVFSKKQIFQQGGMNPNKALELAAKSSGLNPIVQGAMSGYFGQDLVERSNKVFIAKNILGEDLEQMGMSGNYSPQALAAKKRVEANISRGSLNTNPFDILRNSLYQGGLYSVGESPIESRTLQQARTSPSMAQESFTNTVDTIMSQGMGGNTNINPSMEMGKFVQSISGSTVNLDAFRDRIQETTEAMGSLSDRMAQMMSGFNPGSMRNTISGFFGNGKVNDSGQKMNTKSGNQSTGYKAQVFNEVR